jgi:hypothetical protein
VDVGSAWLARRSRGQGEVAERDGRDAGRQRARGRTDRGRSRRDSKDWQKLVVSAAYRVGDGLHGKEVEKARPGAWRQALLLRDGQGAGA